MKFAVCVPPARCDCYGHLTRYAVQLAEVAGRRGIPVEILHFESPDFWARLFANLADEDCVVHFHAFLYDLRMSASPAGPVTTHVVDQARAVTLATISDHPFSDFMQGMVRHASAKTTYIIIEKTFADEMQAINPVLKSARFDYQPFGPPQNYDRAQAKPYDERSLDLVVPVRVVELETRGIDVLLARLNAKWLISAVAGTYEIALADLTRNPFHIFMEQISTVLGKLDFADIRAFKPEVAESILNVMSVLDGIVRQERRHRVIRALLRDVGDLKVAVLCDPLPGLEIDPNVTFIGQQDTPAAIALMADTRAVLNCNPSYPSNLHERVTVGMMYGSCVISDVNTYMSRTFSRAEFLPYEPGATETLAELFATRDIRAIGAAAAKRVHGDRAFSWDGHFDQLMRVANQARIAPTLAAAS
jgi:hypothetical protein